MKKLFKSEEGSQDLLTAVSRNVELIAENRKLSADLEEARNLNKIISQPGGKYLIKIEIKGRNALYDFTPVIELIQNHGPSELTKTLRQIHHDYCVSAIEEMTKALNTRKFTFFDYDEDIPVQMMVLKAVADSIDNITELRDSKHNQ